MPRKKHVWHEAHLPSACQLIILSARVWSTSGHAMAADAIATCSASFLDASRSWCPIQFLTGSGTAPWLMEYFPLGCKVSVGAAHGVVRATSGGRVGAGDRWIHSHSLWLGTSKPSTLLARGSPRTRVSLGTTSWRNSKRRSSMPWRFSVEHLEVPARRLAVHGMQSMQ